MSILNRPSDGLFNVLIVLLRCIIHEGAIPKRKLLDLCAPCSIGDKNQDMATKTLNTWLELGLFTATEDDIVRVSENVKKRLKKRDLTNHTIAGCIRAAIFAAANNENFWDGEGNRAADFNRAASWMLAQDVYAFSPSTHREVERRVIKQIDSSKYTVFQNDTRWQGYVAWSNFVGVGYANTASRSSKYFIDPTLAVREPAIDSLPKRGSVSIDSFLDTLAEEVPVIDGGVYRRAVEQKLDPTVWRQPKSNEVSTSLSRALLRLREAELVQFERKSDAATQIVLLGRNHRTIETITHIRRGGGVK